MREAGRCCRGAEFSARTGRQSALSDARRYRQISRRKSWRCEGVTAARRSLAGAPGCAAYPKLLASAPETLTGGAAPNPYASIRNPGASAPFGPNIASAVSLACSGVGVVRLRTTMRSEIAAKCVPPSSISAGSTPSVSAIGITSYRRVMDTAATYAVSFQKDRLGRDGGGGPPVAAPAFWGAPVAGAARPSGRWPPLPRPRLQSKQVPPWRRRSSIAPTSWIAPCTRWAGGLTHFTTCPRISPPRFALV
jgi:hypothetical protein